MQAVTENHDPAAIIPRDEELAALGIRRVPFDYFYVGEYRYTSLQDALAETRRERGLPKA